MSDTPDQIRDQFARRVAELEEFVSDLAAHGARSDLNPTMNCRDVGTVDEIRALYVETLAQHRSGMNGYYWHVIGPTMRAEYCREVEPDVDALAEAGLLPAPIEGVTP